MEMETAFSVPKKKVIRYPPEALTSFNAYGFEWIDNLHFLEDPAGFIDGDPAPYVAKAKLLFLELGWQGDGAVQLLWLPSFVFPLALKVHTEGLVLWHVKQVADGVSFILSPIPLPFEEFEQLPAALFDSEG